jgi:hypothetical protein
VDLARHERALLPPTGSPRIARALASPSASARRTGSVILTAKPIAGHDAKGERREPRPGRSGCRRCPRSGSRAGDGHQSRIIQRARTRQAAQPGNAAAEPAATAQAARRGRMRLPGTSASLFRRHAERRGRSGRTHADPPNLEPESGCLRCKRRECFVRILLPGGRVTWTVSPPHSWHVSPCRCCFLELSGYFVNTVQLHVNAADVLVRRGIDRDGCR